MTFSTLGIKASSRTGAKGICVFGGVTLIIGLSKLQKPFSATKEEISEAIDEKGTTSCKIHKLDVYSTEIRIRSSYRATLVPR